MSTELIEKLAQDPGPHSAYIEDSELRDMAIVWAVAIRNENRVSGTESEYLKLIRDMMENDPELYRRFNDYLVSSIEEGKHKAAWSEPADRIRKTLLPK
jgi:hypothetical protein